jgi:hypothetical protein
MPEPCHSSYQSYEHEADCGMWKDLLKLEEALKPKV